MKYCSNCGKPVADSARFCGECGATIQSVESGGNGLPEEPSTEVRFYCSHCGTELVGDSREAGATYPCLKCGGIVQVPRASMPMADPVGLPPSASSDSTSAPKRRGRCKYCGQSIPVGSNPCPHCGHELKWPKTSVPGRSVDSHSTSTQKAIVPEQPPKMGCLATTGMAFIGWIIYMIIRGCYAVSQIQDAWPD